MDTCTASSSLAIINNAAISIGIQIYIYVLAFNSFEYIHLAAEFLDHIVIQCLTFWGTTISIFPYQSHHFTFPPLVPRVPIFPHPSSSILGFWGFFPSMSRPVTQSQKWWIQSTIWWLIQETAAESKQRKLYTESIHFWNLPRVRVPSPLDPTASLPV